MTSNPPRTIIYRRFASSQRFWTGPEGEDDEDPIRSGKDAFYVRFADAPVVESEEIRPGFVLDFDAEGRIVGFEVLDASEHMAVNVDLTRLTAA